MEQAHEPIISSDVFDQVQEDMKRRSNIEVVDGKAKWKSAHYSSKNALR